MQIFATMDLVAKLVRIMWIPVLLMTLYTGWMFWQRRSSAPGSGVPREERDPLAAYGTSVKILQFYTRAPEIAPGEKALVCYSVVNATDVRLDPPVEKVWP